MNTSENGCGDRRRRRRHSAEFKAKVIAACRTPGVSMAAVALDHRLNANLLRRWVLAAERSQEPRPIPTPSVVPSAPMLANAAFVPVRVQSAPTITAQDIVIELRRGSTVVKVRWPLAAAAACGAWLGELLQ